MAGCVMLLNACIVGRKVVYVHDLRPDTTYQVLNPPDLQIQPSDRLGITISSRTPELAAPFNPGTGSQLNERGEISGSSAGAGDGRGYLVDGAGEIEFPILGNLQVEGKTLNEAKNLIKQRLIGDKLISDPIVKVELLNLKINMLGEINRVGVLSVPDGRITLLEAIAQAGGLTTNAATDRITVIRQENGQRTMVVNNIESKDIFNSPGYYLQQNDIVYIEPRGAQLSQKEENNWRYVSTGVGLLATIFTILNFLK